MDPESVAMIKSDIAAFIANTGQPSFADLMQIEGFSGDKILGCPNAGIVLWDAISQPAATAIIELLQDGEIDVADAHVSVYRHSGDGYSPDYPVARAQAGPYWPPRWVPILFKLGREIPITLQ